MPKHSQPRRGSLQFWPRKRARKILPSVNWDNLNNSEKANFLGYIAYKVGMTSALVKDNTEDSLTKGQQIILPATILECPPMKLFSIRFYKKSRVIKDVVVSNDKELKKKLKLPKQKKGEKDLDKIVNEVKDYDNLSVIIYSVVKNTGIKKTPDLIEIGLSGDKKDKLNKIKEFLNKEISISDISESFQNNLLDVRGVTKAKGTQGPVKRFGVSLRPHKSEKGIRKVGSIGPWHPPRVMFRVPMAGQTDFFTRKTQNNKIIKIGKISEKNINPKQGWKHYGKIKTDYLILTGSVLGPVKRQLLLSAPLRKTKKQAKKNYELIGLK
jgi:large subunit ribosomal protein L3